MEDNIKLDRKQTGCADMNWNFLTQDADQWLVLIYTVMKIGVP
jgi:hypothetical protein